MSGVSSGMSSEWSEQLVERAVSRVSSHWSEQSVE